MEFRDWLEQIGVGHLAETFERNGVDFELLDQVTNDDLKDMGIDRLADRKRLLAAIEKRATGSRGGEDADGRAEPVYGESERRHLTVMFIDLVGSTVLAERLDPEDMDAVLQHFHDICVPVIQTHAGRVANYFGDGIMAIFGYPVATEEAAANALRAGMDAVRAVQAGNPGISRLVPAGLSLRVAVASGIVVVGRLGRKRGVPAYSIVGETPNLAARLQDFARPNSVVASDATRRLVEGRFDLSDAGLKDIRGLSAPVRIWQVDAERHGSTRFDARPLAAATGLVGRAEELSVLHDRWHAARAGHGGILLLSGEPGIGKSRLCHALRESIAVDPDAVVRLQCSEFRTDSALHPVIECLASAASFRPEDTPEARLEKLTALVRTRLGEDDPTLVQLLAGQLGVPTEDRFPELDLNPAAQKQQTLRGIWRMIAGDDPGRPVLAVIEDAHWIDPTTRELIEIALPDLERQPMLVIVTERPDAAQSLRDRPNVTTLELNRLNAEDARTLVASLVPPATLSREKVLEVLDRTDGVPLFIEEWLRMYLERASSPAAPGAPPEFEIPDTLHDLLLARLDQLGSAKRLAQTAACFGRQFSRRQIEQISAMSEDELRASLERVVSSGLVNVAEHAGEAYEFRHALIQEAAYGSLLQSTRVKLHRRIADEFETEWSESEPESLARHFGLAQEPRKEVDYLHAAALKRMRSSAFVEAHSYYRQALDRLKSAPEIWSGARELELQIQIAVPLTLTRGWASKDVGAAYEQAQQLANNLEDSPLVFPALSGVFTYFMVSGLHRMAHSIAARHLERAMATGDPGAILEFELNAGVAEYYTGQPTEALAHLERSIELHDAERDRDHARTYGKCPATVAMAHAANACALLGRPAAAFDYNDRSARAADEAAHGFSQVWARSNRAINCILYEHPAESGTLAAEIVREAKLRDYVPWLAQGQVWLGWSIAQQGNTTEGIETLRAGMDLWERTGSELMRPFYFVLLAESLARAGRHDEAETAITTCFDVMERTGEAWVKPQAEIRSVEFAMASDRVTPGAADARLRDVSRRARDRGEWLWVAKAERARLRLPGRDAQVDAGPALRAALGRFDDHGQPMVQQMLALIEQAAVT